MAGQALIVQKVEKETYVLLKLDGLLDASTASVLDEALNENQGSKVVLLDLENLTYAASIGLGLLIKHQRAMDASGSRLMLFNVREKVHKVMEMIGLLQVLHIAPSLEAAEQEAQKTK